MAITSTHPDYDDMRPEWRLVKACSEGQKSVKDLKTDILPAPDAKSGVYDKDRYDSYLKRAIYTNVTGRTVSGLTGAAFRVAPDIDLPPVLEYLEDNADGAGQSLEQLSKDVFSSLLTSGREALLVDYPEVPEGLTAEQQRMLDPKAMIKRYCALDLDNWDTEIIAGQEVLTMAKLRETYNANDSEFQHTEKIQYRVLRLVDGVYTQQLYRDNSPIEEQRTPTKADGSVWNRIPLFTVGGQNNDISVDQIPVADIAHVNVGHYRNSADLEECAFINGQSMLHVNIGDMDAEVWKSLNGSDGIAFGSSTSVQTQNGSVDLVQAQEKNLYTKIMEDKQSQMLSLGAKLVEKRNPNETAAAAKIDATGENSVLSDLVTNVEEGIQRCLEWCGEYMGVDVDGKEAFKMNRQFFDDSIDPQSAMAAIQMFDRGAIGKTDLIETAKKAGFSDRTVEDIQAEVGNGSPLD